MDLKAFDIDNVYLFVVRLNGDESPHTWEDIEQAVEARQPLPDGVCAWPWDQQPPEGQSSEEYLQTCRREALLLADLELRRRQGPQEIAIPE